jgi:hypothetical protein
VAQNLDTQILVRHACRRRQPGQVTAESVERRPVALANEEAEASYDLSPGMG